MATDTRNQLDRNDNRAIWTVVTLIVLAVLAYGIYAAYYNADEYSTGATTSATGSDTATGGTATTNQ